MIDAIWIEPMPQMHPEQKMLAGARLPTPADLETHQELLPWSVNRSSSQRASVSETPTQPVPQEQKVLSPVAHQCSQTVEDPAKLKKVVKDLVSVIMLAQSPCPPGKNQRQKLVVIDHPSSPTAEVTVPELELEEAQASVEAVLVVAASELRAVSAAITLLESDTK